MPTNEERREMARKLRYVGEHGGPEWETAACCIAECIGEDDYPLWDGSSPLFAKLADLIEPNPQITCRVVTKERRVSQTQTIVTKQCSRCGHIFGSEEHRPFLPGLDGDMVLGEVHIPAYCEDCGSEVVYDAD